MREQMGIPVVASAACWLLGIIAPTTLLAAEPATLSVGGAPHEVTSRPHVELIATEPADGDTVAGDLGRIRLLFSGAVEEVFSEVLLSGPDGLELSLAVAADARTERALVASVPPLAAGAYRAFWRTVSVDGHSASGSFVFYVRLSAVAPTDPSGAEGRDPVDAEPTDGSGEPEPPPRFEAPPSRDAPFGLDVPASLALSRGVAVAALLALGGLLAMVAWIAPGSSRRAAGLAYLLALLVPLLLAAHLLLWLLSVSPGGRLDLERVPALLGTQAGGLELVRFALAVAVLAMLAFGRHVGSAALLALIATLVSGATGHALLAAPAVSVPAKAAHLVATQLWLGGLLYLIFEASGEPEYRIAARRVSRVALIAVLTIAATGTVQSLVALPSLGSLGTTAYGRLILTKAGGLAILILFGYRNQVRLLPALEEGESAGRLRGSVLWETMVMAVVFVAAAFLAYVPPGS